MPSILFTGFPGFLGSELLPRVLRRSASDVAVCIVQSKFAPLARERATGLVAKWPELANRIRLVEGDITVPITVDVRDVAEVYHLAAVYDLSVPRALGMKVNVDGTRHVLDFAQRSGAHVHYVSTCYVSGRHPGVFRETDLEKGQSFNNFYEETKYLAEVEVQRRMGVGMAATIYRPAVVVGDSSTGATQKFDGPYFVMQWLLRQPRVAFLPVVGRPSRYTFNVVPRNFVVDAMEVLSAKRAQKVYQIADPDPLTVDETIDVIAEACDRKVVRIPLPKAIAKGALEHVPGVYRLMRIPSPAVDYFVHPTSYDTTNAQADLAARPPRLTEYVANLVKFAREHPEIGSAAMV